MIERLQSTYLASLHRTIGVAAVIILGCSGTADAPGSSDAGAHSTSTVGTTAPKTFVVGIIEPMQHIAVSDITRGIRDGLAGVTNVTVEVENANGDASAVPQIVAKYKDRGVDVFVPIFTTTAQAVRASVSAKPIIFAAVTDPVTAGIVKEPDKPEANVTGVSDLWPIGSELDLVREILPKARTIGIVYDPSDLSSSATMSLLEKEAKVRSFVLEKRPVHNVTEISQALAALPGTVDLLFTANDVTVTKVFPALVAFCIKQKTPLFAGDYSSVQRGAIAAVGQNYQQVGVQAGKMIAAVKSGTAISAIPVQYTTGGDVHLNSDAAEKMGVKLSEAVTARASHTYNSISP